MLSGFYGHLDGGRPVCAACQSDRVLSDLTLLAEKQMEDPLRRLSYPTAWTHLTYDIEAQKLILLF